LIKLRWKKNPRREPIMRKEWRVGVILAFLLSVVALAPGVALANDIFTIGSSTYTVNGQAQTMDVAPYIENGRTMLPVRYAAEALGIPDQDIMYFPAQQKVTIVAPYSGNVVQLFVGSNIMTINGTQQITMDTAPEIRDGRICLPVHWIAQGLDANIVWNPDNQQITIGGGGGGSEAIPTPTITPNGGTFTAPVTVTIGNIPSGDTAYYNDADSNPETNGTPYTAPFVESTSNTVTVATRDQNGNWSNAAQTTFFINSQSTTGNPTGGGGGPTTLAAPTGVIVSNIQPVSGQQNSYSITLTWDSVPGAASYVVYGASSWEPGAPGSPDQVGPFQSEGTVSAPTYTGTYQGDNGQEGVWEWYVVAVDANGNQSQPSLRGFTNDYGSSVAIANPPGTWGGNQ
jgi:hypothetical protein